MLFNASHVVTNCGLPPHIQERYIRYKQGNRAIVAWMTKYGPDHFKGKRTLPIKQMVALGSSLCNRIQEIGTLPPDVDFYFKEVIKERTYLSNHYRTHRDQCEDDLADTVNHQHFTESLRQIHEILLTAGKPSARCVSLSGYQKHNRARARTCSSSASSTLNNFSKLSFTTYPFPELEDESDDEAISGYDTDATSECSHTARDHVSCNREINDDSHADFLDIEGDFGLAVEALMFLVGIQKFANAIEVIWHKAGQDEVRLPVAAAYTNVVLVKVNEHVRSFMESESEFHRPADLRDRLQKFVCSGSGIDFTLSDQIQKLLDSLHRIFASLTDTKQFHSNDIDALTRQTDNGSRTDHRLICDLVQDIANDGFGSSLTGQGLHYLRGQSHLTNSQGPLLTCIRIQILATSHRAFSSAMLNPRHTALPRLTALRLAQEAVKSIDAFLDDKSIFPCQCTNTLGYRVSQMRAELNAFVKHRCWNTLIQSPLTAGNHILEILDLCSYYGMYLFHYRQYSAAVLHCYHALARLQQVDESPMLNEICDTFTTVLYPNGVRPAAGFMACWLRYVGARLRFRKGKRYQDHKDTWCMAVPARAAAKSAGLNIGGKEDAVMTLPKFDYGTIDRITRLKRNLWILGGEESSFFDEEIKGISCSGKSMAAKVQQNPSTTPQRKKASHKRTQSCHTSKNPLGPTPSRCHMLHHELDVCFSDNEGEGRQFPTARINLLSFFFSMTRVVSAISDATHAQPHDRSASEAEEGQQNGRGQMCLCFVQTILRATDRMQDVRKRRGMTAAGATLTKGERGCVDCFKEHLQQMLECARVEDVQGGRWLWESI